MRRITLIIIWMAIAAVMGYWIGVQRVEVETIETVRVDTIFYDKPSPVRLHPPSFATTQALFVTSDTVVVTSAYGRDSVAVRVEIERKEYGDSTFRAQISGPVVGDLRPSLDWIETYNRTIERERIVTKRSRFAVTLGAGVSYTPKGIQPHLGIQAGVILWQR